MLVIGWNMFLSPLTPNDVIIIASALCQITADPINWHASVNL